MDIITQATLGAAVGEAAAGRQIGNRAIFWGAGLGILPDLDVLVEPFFSPVQQFLVHRSLTHSILFILVATPLLAALFYRIYSNRGISWKRSLILVFGVLITHVLLDCLNNYGTLVFFPFSTYPVNLNTVFVIDPLYTLPLLLGVLISLFLYRKNMLRRAANGLGLLISSLYLVWAVFAKVYATEQFRDALERQQIEYNRLMTTPTPLNTFLWSGFAEHMDTLYVGLYSVWDEDDRIRFQAIPKKSHLLRYTSHELPMQRVLWFSRGFYAVRKDEKGLRFYDLRFGRSDIWMDESGKFIWGYRFKLTKNGRSIKSFRRTDTDFSLNKAFWEKYLSRIFGN